MVDFYKRFKYLLILFMTIAILLSAITGLNYLINPYQYFNSGILNDGNFTSFKLFKLPSKNIVMYKLSRDIQKTQADTFIIGSSRVLKGFNTCNRPQILKLPKPGMTLSETKILLKEVLKKEGIKTIFIEALWIGTKTEIINPIEKPNFMEAILSLNSFIVSMNTIVDYYQTDESYNYPNCYCVFDQNFSDEHEEKYKTLFKNRLSNFSLNYFVSLIYDIAKEGKNSKNVNIRFIIPPLHKDFVDFNSSPINNNRFRDKINDLKRQFDFVDFISYTDFVEFSPDLNSSLYNKEFWYDKNHFKPIIGDMFLEAMQRPYIVPPEKTYSGLNAGILMLLLD